MASIEVTPGILPKLEQLNPKVGKYRRHKHTQFLTGDYGVPALNQHLATVLTIMRGSKSWDDFRALMEQISAAPRREPKVASARMGQRADTGRGLDGTLLTFPPPLVTREQPVGEVRPR